MYRAAGLIAFLFVCLFVFPLNYYYMVVEARDIQRSEKRQKAKIIVLLK